jgi:ADP-ribose pyrophosphatase YjhB (NUDIX family)
VSIEKEIGGLNSKDRIKCSGALFYAKSTGRILLLQKARGKHSGTWGLVGGTNELSETPWEGLKREIRAEIGTFPDIKKSIPLETFVSNDSITAEALTRVYYTTWADSTGFGFNNKGIDIN